jgi:hypothetical protein
VTHHYIIIDLDGIVQSFGYGTPPDGAIIIDQPINDDPFLFCVDGENGLVPRPSLQPIPFSAGVLSFPQMPNDTLVRVIDDISDEVLFEQIKVSGTAMPDIEIADTGTYLVMVEPPLPWCGYIQEITK